MTTAEKTKLLNIEPGGRMDGAAGEPSNGWNRAGSCGLIWPNGWSQAASGDLACGSLAPPAPRAIKLCLTCCLSLSVSVCLCLSLSLCVVTPKLPWSWLPHSLSYFASSYRGPGRGMGSFSFCLGRHIRFFSGPGRIGSCSRRSWWTLGVGGQCRGHFGERYQLGEGVGDACTSRNLSSWCVCGLMGTLFC